MDCVDMNRNSIIVQKSNHENKKAHFNGEWGSHYTESAQLVAGNARLNKENPAEFGKSSQYQPISDAQLKELPKDSAGVPDLDRGVQTVGATLLKPKEKNRQKDANDKGVQAPVTQPPTGPTRRGSGTSSGGYPGVSWNRRMGAWLGFYYDNYCRRSRTFHPKHFNMDVEAARLAAVSFIKTVERNPRTRRTRRNNRESRSKSPTMVNKSGFHQGHISPVEYVASTPVVSQPASPGGFHPYYISNEDYYGGEAYWNPVFTSDSYSLPDQICSYTSPSASQLSAYTPQLNDYTDSMGYIMPHMGYMNYDLYYQHDNSSFYMDPMESIKCSQQSSNLDFYMNE